MLRRRDVLIGGGAGLVAATAAPTMGLAQAATKWDLPAGYAASNFHSENLVAFANAVRQATNGRLDITVHANASLFRVPEIKRAVQTGQAQIGELLMVILENEDAVFGVDNVPFLATSFPEAQKLADVSKPFIERRLEAQGMRLLYWVPWPPQGFYSPKPLQTGEDLRGLRFRSYGASAGRLAELAGMQVTTVQAAELSQAFATGRVNSMISSGATGFDAKLWEHVKFFYDVQAWLPKNMVMVNARAWAALDAATQRAVTEAAETAQANGWRRSQELANFFLDEFRKNGMTVEAPSAALKQAFQRIGEDLTRGWLQRAGAEGEAIVAAYRRA